MYEECQILPCLYKSTGISCCHHFGGIGIALLSFMTNFFFFFFFCDGQGTVKQANLYVDRSGSELFGFFPQVSQLQDALQSMSSIILQGSLPGSTPATPRSTASSNLLTPGSTGKGR